MPYTLSDEPKRPKLRKDSELPRCKKSRIETIEPKRVMPMTESDEARREKERNDKVLPRWRKSSTATALPMRAKLRKAIQLPK
jgi:hypothetical protein